MRLAFVGLLTLTLGCAFSNTNPFTGKTQWLIGDAVIGCVYNQEGYPECPSDGMAGGAEAIEAVAQAKAEIESFADEEE